MHGAFSACTLTDSDQGKTLETKVYTIKNPASPDEDDIRMIEECGEIIKRGGLVAFPTETVYGLGGDALNDESSGKIYAA